MRKKQRNKTPFYKKNWTIIAFLTLFFLFTIPRLFELLSLDQYFGTEQGELILGARGIARGLSFPLLGPEVGGVGGFAKGPGFTYLLAIPYLLGNGDPFALRIFMFVVSLATLIAAHITSKNIFDEKTALFVAFFAGISPSLIQFSGRVFTPFVMPIFTILFIYCLYKLFLKEEKYLIWLYGLIGAMVHIEIASAGVLFVQSFVITVYLYYKKITSIRSIIFSFLVLFVAFIPMLLFDVQNNFSNSKGILAMVDPQNESFSYFSNLSQLLTNRIELYYWNLASTFSPNKFFIPIMLLFLIFATISYLKDTRISSAQKNLVYFLISSPVVTFLLLLFYPGGIYQWWLFMQTVFYIFLAGVLSSYFLFHKQIRYFILLLVVFLFAGYIQRTYMLYTRDFGLNTKSYIHQLEPIDYIFEDGKNTNFSIVVLSPREKKYEFDYLLSWRSEKYSYQPKRGIGKIFYVLQERDPTTLADARKQLQGIPGKIVSSITFGNRHIGESRYLVEKRIQ